MDLDSGAVPGSPCMPPLGLRADMAASHGETSGKKAVGLGPDPAAVRRPLHQLSPQEGTAGRRATHLGVSGTEGLKPADSFNTSASKRCMHR
ncbi:hypothetical protein NDU88_000261 [Pleurodeles waltl]|uniref:Uncharacterized protein n=1 Tax=Pleurodeles waltl TaxID=8319 RepID=A0AAV7U307_PLEWA|nr:hypothetical protein NDU88_000261 [Pleurodeles waltl]